jgi:hypothetical protein
LVNRHPIYTWADAKFNHDHGVSPFRNIDYIPGSAGSGYFAVVGECADGLVARIGNQLVHQVELEDGGMYVFSESGQFIAKENVCRETATPRICYEGGGCYVNEDISLVGNGQFILDAGGAEFGLTIHRSPLLYSVQGNNVSRENRLFFWDWQNPVDPFTEKELLEFRHIAYANGIMVGYAKESLGHQPAGVSGFPGAGPTEEKNIFFSVPEFQRLAEISVPTRCETRSCTGSPSVTQEIYIPIFGIGEYFVTARPDSLHYNINVNPPYDVYRMSSRQELRDGERPEKVQTLDIDRTIANITRDATNPNRVMVSYLRGSDLHYTIYEPGQAGLEDVGSGTLNVGQTAPFFNIALSGEYRAYTSCEKVGDNDIFDFRNLLSCQLVVERNGQPLSVEPLPLNLFSGGSMPGVAISPSGYIMVAAYNLTGIDGENGNLYLYKIGGVTAPPGPGAGPGPGIAPNLGPVQTYTPDLNFFLNLSRSYTDQLSGIFLKGNTADTGSQTSSSDCPPATEAEIKAFQCNQGIVCSGTIETTGYGNLGPATKAKIAEIYPATVRQSCGLNY